MKARTGVAQPTTARRRRKERVVNMEIFDKPRAFREKIIP